MLLSITQTRRPAVAVLIEYTNRDTGAAASLDVSQYLMGYDVQTTCEHRAGQGECTFANPEGEPFDLLDGGDYPGLFDEDAKITISLTEADTGVAIPIFTGRIAESDNSYWRGSPQAVHCRLVDNGKRAWELKPPVTKKWTTEQCNTIIQDLFTTYGPYVAGDIELEPLTRELAAAQYWRESLMDIARVILEPALLIPYFDRRGKLRSRKVGYFPPPAWDMGTAVETGWQVGPFNPVRKTLQYNFVLVHGVPLNTPAIEVEAEILWADNEALDTAVHTYWGRKDIKIYDTDPLGEGDLITTLYYYWINVNFPQGKTFIKNRVLLVNAGGHDVRYLRVAAESPHGVTLWFWARDYVPPSPDVFPPGIVVDLYGQEQQVFGNVIAGVAWDDTEMTRQGQLTYSKQVTGLVEDADASKLASALLTQFQAERAPLSLEVVPNLFFEPGDTIRLRHPRTGDQYDLWVRTVQHVYSREAGGGKFGQTLHGVIAP